MANPRVLCAVFLVIVLVAGIVFFTGWEFPGQEGFSGDLGFTFYDENGDPIRGDLAYMAAGTIITGFRINFALSASGNLPLVSATFEGVIRYKIYGINDVQETETLRTTVEATTFIVNDYDEPMGCSGNWYSPISILDAYAGYRDTGGWKIVAEIDATVNALNSDMETLSDDWSGSAYFCIWWQAGELTLTGEVGVG